jgi:hypothetical protein
MLNMLRGKRLVFVGDSLSRNMWQSLVCALRESFKDKSRNNEGFGRRKFRTKGFYSFRFRVSLKKVCNLFYSPLNVFRYLFIMLLK